MSDSIITTNDYGEIMNLTDEGDANPHVTAAIAAASGVMVDYTGRQFVRGNADEPWKGMGGNEYYVTHCRILAESETPEIAAAVLYYYAGTATGTNWEVSARNFEFNTESGLIWFTDPYDRFYSSAYRVNWRLTYEYGWAQGDMPDQVKYLCARIAHLILKQVEHDGTSSLSFAGATTTYALNALPPDLREQWNAYKSPRAFEV